MSVIALRPRQALYTVIVRDEVPPQRHVTVAAYSSEEAARKAEAECKGEYTRPVAVEVETVDETDQYDS